MHQRDRGGYISVIQEALKRAQYDYANKKSLPQARPKSAFKISVPAPGEALDKRAIVKRVIIIVSVIALCALVTGFGIRMIFSKMLMVEKEKRSKILITAGEKADSDKAVPVLSVKTPQPAMEEPVAEAPSEPEDRAQSFVLNGIMHLKKGPRAIINGTVVTEGDVIGGATVTSIDDSKVLLKYINSDNKVEMVLKLKE